MSVLEKCDEKKNGIESPVLSYWAQQGIVLPKL
jgi:hypothetical protein